MVCDEVGAPPAHGECSVDQLSQPAGRAGPGCAVGWAVHIRVRLKSELLQEQPVPSLSLTQSFLFSPPVLRTF